MGFEMNSRYRISQNVIYLLRKLLGYVGISYFVLVFLQIISSVCLPLLTIALPGLVARLYLGEENINRSILFVTGFIVAILLLKVLLTYLAQKIKGICFLFRIDMGDELLDDILDMEYAEFESSEGRDRLRKAQRAFYNGNEIGVEALLNHNMILFTNLLGLGVYSVISAKLNPWIFLVLIITSIINGITNHKNRKWADTHKDDWTPVEKKIQYMNDQMIDIGNSKDIRIYNMGDWFKKAFEEMKAERLGWFKKEYTRYYFQNFLERTTFFVKESFLYLYLIYQMSKGMPLDAFLVYLGVAAGFNAWMKEIFNSIHEMGLNSDVVNDYRTFHEKTKKVAEAGNLNVSLNNKHIIEFKEVSFSYPGSDKPALDNLNLVFKPDEKTALVGINGAGKSTLVKLMCGLYTPTKGKIYMDGVDIRSIPKKAYFKEFSVIFQEVFSFAFSIEDNITCQPEGESNKELLVNSLKNAGLLERIESMPKKLDTSMGKELDREGVLLSGGEMQKLMLSRALYKNAPVVILDEPTAALDPLAESSMYEKYNSYVEGKTSVFISHRLSSTRFCDRILLLSNGAVIEEGSHEELLKKQGEYSKMFQIQAHYYKNNENKEEQLWMAD